MRISESLTFHFDLRHCPADVEFTLQANGRKHKLTSYRDAPHKLQEHRSRNRALGMLHDEALSNLTHFVEDAEGHADGLALRSVVYPSRDNHPLPELAVVFMHIPHEQRKAALRRRRAKGLAPRPHMLFEHYDVPHDRLRALSAEEQDAVEVDAALIVGPLDSARTIVFHHPEIGTVDTDVADQVFRDHIRRTPAFKDLIQYISLNGPDSGTPWYRKTYAQWQDPDTKQWVNVTPDPDAVDKDKKKLDWPNDDKGKPAIPQYDLPDEFSSGDPGVMGAAAPCVAEALIAIKNDDTLGGQLWTRQSGTTAREQTNVTPTLDHAHSRLKTLGLGAASKGWTIKNQTSSYGLDLYADDVQFDKGTNKLTFPVKNWPNRYLGAYVQFLKQDGTPIPRSAIPGWTDDMPEFLRPIFEVSQTKNFINWLSPGNQVFGISTPTNPVPLDFVWPKDATHASVLVGGLGCAGGFRDWDGEVDVLGVVSTGLISYGFTALSMAFTVYVMGPIMSMISYAPYFMYGIYGIAAIVGVTGTVYGAVNHDTNTGKFILSKLSNIAAGVIFGKIAQLALEKMYKEAVERIVRSFLGFVTAEEALHQIPFAGWALKVASVASSIASLAATTVESVLSPATYDLAVLHTMDLTVTITPDPRHGKDGHKPIWPLVADHYRVELTYPKGAGQEGGTNFVHSGPMPGAHDAPIEVVFAGVPAGGKCEITAGVYSANNWLAGQWASGWINADPDADSQLKAGGAIFENLVPLTAKTTYGQKQRVIYDSNQQRHLWQGTQFTIDLSLAGDLDVPKVSDDLKKAFASNGNTLSNQAAVKIDAKGSQWTLTDSGVTFRIDKKENVLAVQNLTNASPQLPAVLNDCGTGGDNHNMCARVGVTINNKEYQLGYAWQASGQNLPLDNGNTPQNGQMYTFQSISTLGQPQDQIIEPARGFSQQASLAFNQFGMTPVMDLDIKNASALDAGGAIPADVAKALASFNLPPAAQVKPVTKGKEWLIGVPGSDPLFVLRVVTDLETGQARQIINVYSYPLPAIDNYWVDPRMYATDGLYHLRGVTFPPGASKFDDSTGKSWGAFTQAHLNAVAVHPQGYAVGIDFDNHKLFVVRLPAEAMPEAKAPLAMPLSGQGEREGLMKQPVAMTIAADGRILVLEQGNSRVQAFDVKGNAVPSFTGPLKFALPASFIAALDSRTPNLDLMKALQQRLSPSVARLFGTENASSAGALDQGKADDALTTLFASRGYELPKDASKIAVTVTKAGSLWFLADNVKNVTYDIRLDSGHLSVYYAFSLTITVKAPGQQWTLHDATSVYTFDITKPVSGGDLAARQLVSTMALRSQSGTIRYQDIAVENKGYIYILAAADQGGGKQPIFQLDIYNPDGTVLLDAPQTGLNAAKMAVDRWRTLFTMNFDRVLGPGGRTEPGISAWTPSTPGSPS